MLAACRGLRAVDLAHVLDIGARGVRVSALEQIIGQEWETRSGFWRRRALRSSPLTSTNLRRCVPRSTVKSGVCCSPRSTSASGERETRFVEAAKNVGVRHLAKLAGIGAQAAASFLCGRQPGQAEQLVMASGLPFTFVHPNFLMQNIFWSALAVRKELVAMEKTFTRHRGALTYLPGKVSEALRAPWPTNSARRSHVKEVYFQRTGPIGRSSSTTC